MPRVELPAANRRWILVNALAGAVAVNLVVNTLLAVLDVLGRHSVAYWSISVSHPSVMTDTLGTLLILPAVTTLLVTAAVRRDLSGGRLPSLPLSTLGGWSMLAAPGLGHRAARIAGLTFAALAVPAAAVIRLTAHDGVAAHHFAVYHVALTVVLGAVVTPLIALVAMTDAPPAAPRPLSA